MKKLVVLLFIASIIFACTQDEIPPIGEKTNYIPMLTGTWNLVEFVQIDADAESKSFPDFASSKDLTNAFQGHPYTDFSITFNEDGTFTSDKGSSYMQMLESGNWEINDNDYPSAIILTNGTESQTVSLGSLADVIIGKVEFRENRVQAESGKVKIKYTYSLTKN
jgi:hypothetical protein